MFKYFMVEDLVSLEVSEYLGDVTGTLAERFDSKYVDKIISGVGLVVLVDEISVSGKPKILPNDASALFSVKLKLLVFAPEREERITGTVNTSDVTGIGLSLGFFSDVKLLPMLLPDSVVFDRDAKGWCRRGEEPKKAFKNGSALEFKVSEVIFNERNDASKDDKLPVMLVVGTLP